MVGGDGLNVTAKKIYIKAISKKILFILISSFTEKNTLSFFPGMVSVLSFSIGKSLAQFFGKFLVLYLSYFSTFCVAVKHIRSI